MAEWMGIKFGSERSGSMPRSIEMIPTADPQSAQAIIAQFGGSGEIGKYVAPAKGLRLN